MRRSVALIMAAVFCLAEVTHAGAGNNTAQLDSEYQQALEALRATAPMRPADIIEEKARVDKMEKAAEPNPALMKSESRILNLQPGRPPHTIRLSPGYASSLIFTDVTGAAWPITSAVVGNPQAFNVVRPEIAPGNYLSVVPLTNYTPSSLTLTLQDAPYPVVMSLVVESSIGQHRVSDALIAFRVDQRGPAARQPIVEPTRGHSITPEMLSFLDGIPPNGASPIKITSKQDILHTKLWAFNSQFYLKTPATVLWPAWSSIATGVDGVNLYIIPKTNALLLSINGQQAEVSVDQ